MATEILINDGGAPARVLPILNGTTAIEAGTYVDIHTDGTLKIFVDDQKDGTDKAQACGVGVLLSDAAAGAMGSVISGRGIICNVQAASGVAIGDNVCIDNAGKVETQDSAETDRAVGVALLATFAGTDSGGNATNFAKVLLF